MHHNSKTFTLFTNGSTWLRADFHLHTKADKEFKYVDEENSFIKNYIEKLSSKNIHVGVITNHNKFDLNEFVALKKKAAKAEILLLPGIELSINDGANGIHTLVVFSNQWLENGHDYINQFLNVAFEGKTPSEYEQENGRSTFNLIETIKKLNGYHHDYFLVFAHVEQTSGLWKELKGGRIQELGRNKLFTERTLGFQKVRTHDLRSKMRDWLNPPYPAEVEGSDNKSIDDIGNKSGETWLKIGDFTFEAVKYALTDSEYRVRAKHAQPYAHAYLKHIAFDGGILTGQQIDFSPELNSLIGIRGSGKSAILEAVRYVLDIPFGDKTTDQKYKDALVAHTLGSGGKATMVVIDKNGQEYRVSRILNEPPKVVVGETVKPGIAIRETIIHKPIYFGQKDLSSTGEGFENDLVEKLVGEKLSDIRKQIGAQKRVVCQQCDRLTNLASIDERMKENRAKRQDAEFRLKIYQDNGIEDKLKRQTNFDTDERKIKAILNDINDYENALMDVVNQYEDELKNHLLYKSKQNNEFFKQFFELYNIELASFDAIKTELGNIRLQLDKIKEKQITFSVLKKAHSEQFAEIRRSLESNLREQDKQLNLEAFPKLQKTIETTSQLLESLGKERKKSSAIQAELGNALSKLGDLWHQEFALIDTELKKVNENHTPLQISSAYQGDKTAFKEFFKTIFKGSRVRENSFQRIVNNYSDFTAVFNDFDNLKNDLSGSAEIFQRYFFDHLGQFLNYQIPNKFMIKYHDKALQQHSLGQRASALILFVLSQKENDLVIIDQPEDDLDNQTIYKDVIQLVRQLKPQTQFIFATHNANFPVLGDSEQIHACRYVDDTLQVNSGSIDSPSVQQEIVDIMEGGEDAFNKRKEIYQIWKPLNF